MRNKFLENYLLTLIIANLVIFSIVNLSSQAFPYPASKYDNLLQKITNLNYSFVLPHEYNNQKGKICIIVHDVDFSISGVKVFTEIEKKFNIKSCFYLRPEADYFKQNINYFKKLEKEGFEIGFHYATLSRVYPSRNLATEIFVAQLKYLRNWFDIKTVRAHGDKYDFSILNYQIYDSQLWSTLNITDFSNVHLKDFTYIADTNHVWKEPSEYLDLIFINLHSDWW